MFLLRSFGLCAWYLFIFTLLGIKSHFKIFIRLWGSIEFSRPRFENYFIPTIINMDKENDWPKVTLWLPSNTLTSRLYWLPKLGYPKWNLVQCINWHCLSCSLIILAFLGDQNIILIKRIIGMSQRLVETLLPLMLLGHLFQNITEGAIPQSILQAVQKNNVNNSSKKHSGRRIANNCLNWFFSHYYDLGMRKYCFIF